ncbi:MAG: hypothetical protein H0S85_05375 [Desulfovibrionaceae bacterium]|jgi:hypothetical protein|nr:hypothetical protein [Desulfovibrionaceae bacterium]
MTGVIALDIYRRRKYARRGIGALLAPAPPRINDGALLGRNYATLEGMVFGVLKVREILDWHLGTDDGPTEVDGTWDVNPDSGSEAGPDSGHGGSVDWQRMLLLLLDSCQNQGPDARIRRAMLVGELKRTVTLAMTPANRKDLSNALLLLDLILRASDYAERQTARST